jgi:hypothetical protein
MLLLSLIYKSDRGLVHSLRTFKSIMSHYVKYKKYLGKQ